MPTAFRASWCRHALGLALVGLVLPGLLNSRPARADMIFLKDGFAIQGQVKREMTLEFDKVGGDMYHMPKGFFFVDDGPRRIFFSPSQVRLVYPKDPPIEERIVCKDWRMQVNPKLMPEVLEIVKAPEWDDKWNRRVQFRGPLPPTNVVTLIDVPQHLGLLTPYSARADSPGKFFWKCYYMTRELGPQTVQTLLSTHPDFQEKKGMEPDKRTSTRLRKADFYAQAGWFELADKELDRAQTDLPMQKERIVNARKALRKLRARDRLEEIKHRHLAGQHQLVRKRLADFDTRDVPETLVAQLQELRAEYETTDQLLAETARLLDKARREVEGPDGKLWSEAAAAIAEELNFENVGRLEAFVGQARQAERLQRKGKKAEITAELLLSLAVSGWLMGSASAETNPDTALRLWHGRQMVLAYLRTEDEAQRADLLRKHTGRSRQEAASLDELIQIVRTLPPVEAEKELPSGTVERKTDAGKYLLRLPPEYRHSRPSPVLIVLHNGNEVAKDMLDRWVESAAEHGYILAAPQWGDGVSGYTYSEGEHALVLSTLRDLRRRYNVDSDRAFLFGLGDGGAMAFDVGLGHPDLFAGVLPMAAGPQYHAEICWRNGQKLPFYVMHGDRGPRGKEVRQQFENWVYRSFPMVWVDYKGRGIEWYGGELPNMFDWMRSKKRDFPMHQLGTDGGGQQFGNEFCTMRACDNHFYWFSADDIHPACLNSAANWKRRQPASLYAQINREKNSITVRTSGIRRATIWLGRNDRGEDMIDFDKPITVLANLQARISNQRVKPSAEVMLGICISAATGNNCSSPESH